MEKEIHASTWAKYAVLLAKTNKWKGEAIDRENKLSKVKDELNDISRNFKELREAQWNAQVEVEAFQLEESKRKRKFKAR